MKKNCRHVLLFLILLNTSQCILSILENEDNYQEYLSYCEKFNKEPSNFRFVIWRVRLRKIELKNRISKLRNTFKSGLTKFTDLTDDEREKYISKLEVTNSIPKVKGGEILKNFKVKNISNSIRSTKNSWRTRLRRRWESFLNRIRGIDETFLSTFIKDYPTEINWVTKDGGKVTGVKNQGECGSCWAFAVNAAIESLYLIEKGEKLDLSEQELVDCAPDMNCDGGWNDVTFKYIVENGITTESKYPYLEVEGNCQDITEDRIEISEYKNIASMDMKGFLEVLSKQPIAVALQVENDFLDYKSGIIDADEQCGVTRSVNHAVLAVGYFISSDFKNNYILFKNQWGKEWGDDGYFKFNFWDDVKTNGPCNILMYSDHTTYPVL